MILESQEFDQIPATRRYLTSVKDPVPLHRRRYNKTADESLGSRRDIAIESTPIERFISALEMLWGIKGFRGRSTVAHRLTTLRSACLDEGLELSVDSVEQFVRFIAKHRELRTPDLAITGEGNVRASWSPEIDRHLAIEFLGGQSVKFVLFAPRQDIPVARLAGTEASTLIVLRAEQMGADWFNEHSKRP